MKKWVSVLLIHVKSYLENVRVPRENLLGDEKKGFSQFLYTLDGGRISIAALSVGIAQAAFEKALQFAKERNSLDNLFLTFKPFNLSWQIWQWKSN